MVLSKTYSKFIFSQQFFLLNIFLFLQVYLLDLLKKIFPHAQSKTFNTDSILFILWTLVLTLLFGGLIKIYLYFYLGKSLNLHSEGSISSFAFPKIGDWFVTEIRIQLRVLLFFLLLIIPGVIEALRLTFSIPYVFFDSRMKDPSFDPVKESRSVLHLTSSSLLPLFFIYFLTPFIVGFAASSFIGFESFDKFLLSVFIVVVTALITVFTTLYMLSLYIQIGTQIEKKD